MSRDAIVIEALEVSKAFVTEYQTIEALKDVSLQVHEREFLSIIGPTGCGKSTLLSVLGGLEPPTRGEVRLEGKPLTGPRPNKIGIVFQDYSLLPWRTVLSNVELGLEFRAASKAERRDVARRYIKLVGLEPFTLAYPHQLSGGMKQRVAIARSLTLGCRLLLMDEPFGALDEQSRMLMGQELLAVQEQTGCSVVFVTHSVSEAVRLSDRVVLMGARPGRIMDTTEIDVPRPRTFDVQTGAAFLDATGRLWKQLADQWTESDLGRR